MSKKLRWGVLGGAKIAINRLIPAIKESSNGILTAIASRSRGKADLLAAEFDIPFSYSSYDDLVNSAEIDAVYIPLPNHLHVPFAIKAAEAGKHVLCEKPIAMTSDEAQSLIEVRNRTNVVIQEAFMVMTNPVWSKAKELIQSGEIGDLRTVIGNFSYTNMDAGNVRNVPEYGGGALMDIGCYLILASRFYFDAEPVRVSGACKIDPEFGVDYLSSALLEFEKGTSIITCSTRGIPAQMLNLEGTTGRIRFEIPFSQPADRVGVLYLDQGADIFSLKTSRIEIPAFNQYRLHVERFAQSVYGEIPQPMSLENSVANMKVLDLIRL